MATLESRASAPASESSTQRDRAIALYPLIGVYFGWLLVKGEVASWFRIQEMFRFQSFHMYGIIGSAIAVAMLSLWVIRRLDLRDRNGEPIVVAPKEWRRVGTRYWAGGIIFGLGWALAGACPGPMFTLLGAGVPVILVPIGSALVGAWLYGWARPALPH